MDLLEEPWVEIDGLHEFPSSDDEEQIGENDTSRSSESFGEQRMEFKVEHVKTFYSSKKTKKKIFGDFTLNILGELINEAKPNEGGYWVCSCKGFSHGSRALTRNVVLPATSFQTPAKFIADLNSSFGGGTFLLNGCVSKSDLSEYLVSLKSDYLMQATRHYFKVPNFIGYMGNSYWYLSQKAQVQNGRLLGPDDVDYYATDSDLSDPKFKLVIHPSLLNSGNTLVEVNKRFLELSEGFGANKESFQLATSFVLSKLLRLCTSDKERKNTGETKVAMLHCPPMNVGKSLSQEIINYGQGTSIREHHMFISGGNQNTTGTSLRAMMNEFKKSNLVFCVNDVVQSEQFGEMLLQYTEGLVQGSMSQGMYTAKASGVLISTNDTEVARLHGRILRFDYSLDPNWKSDPENERKLKQLLSMAKTYCESDWLIRDTCHDLHCKLETMDFCDVAVLGFGPVRVPHTRNYLLRHSISEKQLLRQQGFLLAWVIKNVEVWEKNEAHGCSIISSLVNRYLPDEQKRWCDAIASTIYTKAVYFLSLGLNVDLAELVEIAIRIGQSTRSGPSIPFMERLEENLVHKVDSEQCQTLHWLNPTTKLQLVSKEWVPCVVVKASVFSEFSDISATELKAQICNRGGEKAFCCSVAFATNEIADERRQCTVLDLHSRTEDVTSMKRGHKIALKEFSEYGRQWLKFAFEGGEKPQKKEPGCAQEFKIRNEDRENLMAFQDVMEENRRYLDPEPVDTDVEAALEQLTPRKRKVYDAFTPRRRKSFEMGVKAMKKTRRQMAYSDSENNNGQETLRPETLSTSVPTEASHSVESQGTKVNTVEKPRLFARGAAGVLPRVDSKSENYNTPEERPGISEEATIARQSATFSETSRASQRIMAEKSIISTRSTSSNSNAKTAKSFSKSSLSGKRKKQVSKASKVEEEAVYCYCRKVIKTYGTIMISCESGRADCPGYNQEKGESWFHMKCLGMKQQPGEHEEWKCPECIVQETFRRPTLGKRGSRGDSKGRRGRGGGIGRRR